MRWIQRFIKISLICTIGAKIEACPVQCAATGVRKHYKNVTGSVRGNLWCLIAMTLNFWAQAGRISLNPCRDKLSQRRGTRGRVGIFKDFLSSSINDKDLIGRSLITCSITTSFSSRSHIHFKSHFQRVLIVIRITDVFYSFTICMLAFPLFAKSP